MPTDTLEQLEADPQWATFSPKQQRQVAEAWARSQPDFSGLQPQEQQHVVNVVQGRYPDRARAAPKPAARISDYPNLSYLGAKGRDVADNNLLRHLNDIAGQYQLKLGISSAYRPGAITKSGHVSRHDGKHAVDIATINGIPVTSKQGKAWGDLLNSVLMKQGFLQNAERPGSRSVIWQSNVGGNHFNHLHVSMVPSPQAAAARSLVPGYTPRVVRPDAARAIARRPTAAAPSLQPLPPGIPAGQAVPGIPGVDLLLGGAQLAPPPVASTPQPAAQPQPNTYAKKFFARPSAPLEMAVALAHMPEQDWDRYLRYEGGGHYKSEIDRRIATEKKMGRGPGTELLLMRQSALSDVGRDQIMAKARMLQAELQKSGDDMPLSVARTLGTEKAAALFTRVQNRLDNYGEYRAAEQGNLAQKAMALQGGMDRAVMGATTADPAGGMWDAIAPNLMAGLQELGIPGKVGAIGLSMATPTNVLVAKALAGPEALIQRTVMEPAAKAIARKAAGAGMRATPATAKKATLTMAARATGAAGHQVVPAAFAIPMAQRALQEAKEGRWDDAAALAITAGAPFAVRPLQGAAGRVADARRIPHDIKLYDEWARSVMSAPKRTMPMEAPAEAPAAPGAPAAPAAPGAPYALPRRKGQPTTPAPRTGKVPYAPQRPSPAQSGAVETPPTAPAPVETPAPVHAPTEPASRVQAFLQAVRQAPEGEKPVNAPSGTRSLLDVFKIMRKADPKLTRPQFAATVDYAHNAPDVPLEAEGPSGAIRPSNVFTHEGRRFAYVTPKEVTQGAITQGEVAGRGVSEREGTTPGTAVPADQGEVRPGEGQRPGGSNRTEGGGQVRPAQAPEAQGGPGERQPAAVEAAPTITNARWDDNLGRMRVMVEGQEVIWRHNPHPAEQAANITSLRMALNRPNVKEYVAPLDALAKQLFETTSAPPPAPPEPAPAPTIERAPVAATEGQRKVAPAPVETAAAETPSVAEGWVNPDEIGVKPGMQYKREGITDTATGTGHPRKPSGGRSLASREAPGATAEAPTEANTAPATPVGAVAQAMEQQTAAPGPQSLPVPAPELVSLARRLMGSFPGVKRFPKARGRFYPEGEGRIGINPAAAKDPVELARTLAHEIGHLADYQPDQAMDRGNILGRIGTLRRWLRQTIGELPATPDDFLTPKERAKIRRDAMKAVGKPPADDVAAWRAEVAREYRERIDDEIGRRNLVTRQEIHDELMALSEWWRPYEPGRNASYDAYRASSPELYADALSVWLNAPAELQQRAPRFYRMLGHYLERKPNVLEAYADVQQVLHGTPEGLADARRADIRRGFLRGENVMRATAAERQLEKQSFFDYVAQQLADVGMPAIKRENELLRRGITIAEEQSARYALDELGYRDNANHTFLRAVERDVAKPLTDANVDLMDAGEYLLMRRIMTERKEIPNPWGHTPETAAQMMADLEKRLGPDRFGALQTAMPKLDDLVFKVAQEAVDTGAYNKTTFDEVIAPNKGQYAAFAVVDYLGDNIPAGIRQQVGTFKEVANPFTATVMKTMSLIRLNELQRAKRAVVDQMLQHFPDEIAQHKVPPKGVPPRLAPGNDHIVVLENGRPVYYETDRYTAAIFQHSDIGMISRAAKAVGRLSHKVFHPLYVTFNPSFQAANLFRDLNRTWTNLGATEGITLRQVLGAYRKAIPAAVRRARGLPDATIDEMIASKALDVPFSRFDLTTESTAYDRMMARYGLTDLKEGAKPKLVEVLGKLASPIHVVGDAIEAVPKVAAYRLLTERGVTGKRRSYAVRNYVGTPNLRRRGMSTEITGNLLMYSNVALQGLRADAEIALAPRTASGWWMRTALTTVAPKLAMKAAAAGLMGYAVEQMMDAVPEYDKTNYLIIPFGWASNGKVGYLRIPHGDSQRLLAGLAWKLGEGRLPEAAQFSYGQLPNLAPSIAIPAKWAEYGRGQNPRDELRGREIISPDAYAAGGWYALNDMLHYSIGQFGVVSTVATAVTGKPGELTPPTTTERIVGMLPGIERFVRWSDRGISEQEWDTVRERDAAAALTRLRLPKEARQLTREQNRLMRLWTAGGIDATDRSRLNALNGWASGYKRHITVLKAREEAGDTRGATALRETIRRTAVATQKRLLGTAYQSPRPGREPATPYRAGSRGAGLPTVPRLRR